MGILSSTQLHDVRLSNLVIRYNDEWIWTEDDQRCEETYEVSPDFDVFPSQDETSALIRLSLRCAPMREAEGRCRFSEVSGTVWCVMVFEHEVETEERVRRAYLNGPVILHGVLRGIIASATGTCVGGPFLLPVVNYMQVLAQQMAQLELPDLIEQQVGDEGEPATDPPEDSD